MNIYWKISGTRLGPADIRGHKTNKILDAKNKWLPFLFNGPVDMVL